MFLDEASCADAVSEPASRPIPWWSGMQYRRDIAAGAIPDGVQSHAVHATRRYPLPMQVTVQLRSDVARALQGKVADDRLTHAVFGVEEDDVGFRVQRMHPGVSDTNLASYLFVEVDDPRDAEKAVEKLRRSPVVEAAYLQAQPDLP